MINYIITLIFVLCYFAVTIWQCRGIKLNARTIAFAGIMCAATLVLASVYIPLPTGASISAGSMIPIMLLALCFDYRAAYFAGWISGILALVLIPVWQPVHWAQVFVEHLICFSCLGYAGRFGYDKKWKTLCGVALAIAIKIVAHILAGVVFFSQNAWAGWGAWGYSILYNLSSCIPEAIITIVILVLLPIPTLRRALKGELQG